MAPSPNPGSARNPSSNPPPPKRVKTQRRVERATGGPSQAVAANPLTKVQTGARFSTKNWTTIKAPNLGPNATARTEEPVEKQQNLSPPPETTNALGLVLSPGELPHPLQTQCYNYPQTPPASKSLPSRREQADSIPEQIHSRTGAGQELRLSPLDISSAPRAPSTTASPTLSLEPLQPSPVPEEEDADADPDDDAQEISEVQQRLNNMQAKIDQLLTGKESLLAAEAAWKEKEAEWKKKEAEWKEKKEGAHEAELDHLKTQYERKLSDLRQVTSNERQKLEARIKALEAQLAGVGTGRVLAEERAVRAGPGGSDQDVAGAIQRAIYGLRGASDNPTPQVQSIEAVMFQLKANRIELDLLASRQQREEAHPAHRPC
ncbi:uncharacterized protein LOC62_05G006795 [Vanrija pseudolonga]|uniref:Uncharacterized protein n=1 Tax=Vanrija pseudolonga TaxID=143232 RepID=A0AAF0YAM9_9TREE|nr:hypothetical protein LOC62_05G006795 [Vanrija pseudolonga]